MALTIDYTTKVPRKATGAQAAIAECPKCGRLGATKKIAGTVYYTHIARRSGTGGDMRAVPVEQCAVEVEEVRA